jgi:hypothetical protein
MIYINVPGKNGKLHCLAQPLKPEGDFVRKSLHEGICGNGRYPIWVGFIRVTQRLVLCNCGNLGKGTLRMYPSLSVPTKVSFALSSHHMDKDIETWRLMTPARLRLATTSAKLASNKNVKVHFPAKNVSIHSQSNSNKMYNYNFQTKMCQCSLKTKTYQYTLTATLTKMYKYIFKTKM